MRDHFEFFKLKLLTAAPETEEFENRPFRQISTPCSAFGLAPGRTFAARPAASHKLKKRSMNIGQQSLFEKKKRKKNGGATTFFLILQTCEGI